MSAVSIVEVTSERDLGEARALFEEYRASLDFDLCFQGFAAELAELPGRYAPPSGRLLLAHVDDAVAGCIALRDLGQRVCEMKRLFVRPRFHKQGVGRALAIALLEKGRIAGYTHMRLDTVPAMTAAIALYTSLGFRDIAPYTENPIAGARFLEVAL